MTQQYLLWNGRTPHSGTKRLANCCENCPPKILHFQLNSFYLREPHATLQLKTIVHSAKFEKASKYLKSICFGQVFNTYNTFKPS